jgi:hypothetical protein
MLSIATAAEDLRTTSETLRKRLSSICMTFGWHFDAEARVFYIPSWWRWNAPENANVLKGNLKDLNDIPPCGLVDAFARNTGNLPETLLETFFDGVRRHVPQPSSNQKQYQESESEEQKREHSALRAGAINDQKPKSVISVKHRQIASVVLRETPHADTEYLVDAFQFHCREGKIEAIRHLSGRAARLANRRGSLFLPGRFCYGGSAYLSSLHSERRRPGANSESLSRYLGLYPGPRRPQPPCRAQAVTSLEAPISCGVGGTDRRIPRGR